MAQTSIGLNVIPKWLTNLPEEDRESFFKEISKQTQTDAQLRKHFGWKLDRLAICQADLDNIFTCRGCKRSVKQFTPSDLFDQCFSHPANKCDERGICRVCHTDPNPPVSNEKCISNPPHHLSGPCRECFPKLSASTQNKGCIVVDEHEWGPIGGYWEGFVAAPQAEDGVEKRRLVCIDAEFAGIQQNEWVETLEIVAFSAFDVLTNETLIDCMVKPDETITDYKEKWTGINKEDLEAAVAQGKALLGLASLQQEFLKFIDSNTIIMGWALGNDLKALKLAHRRVIDVQVPTGICKLRDYALARLGITIQQGKHNSLEDAFIVSELARANWCSEHKVLREWKRQQAGFTRKTTGNKKKVPIWTWICQSCECGPHEINSWDELRTNSTLNGAAAW